jgi:glucose-1-phosphate cytidylyltransferase
MFITLRKFDMSMNNDIPVLILCGGLGSRLGSETESIPKPMVTIGGQPILWHIMKIYSYWGYKNFILALGYKSEVIKDYFMFYHEYVHSLEINLGNSERKCLDSYEPLNWNIKLINTGDKTQKGGRIKRVEKYVDSDWFMLTYGDGVADINIEELVKFHKSHGKPGTVTGVNPPSRFGELIVENDKLVSFSEKPQVSQGIINGGFFVFEKDLFDYLTPDENCGFEVGTLEDWVKHDKLRIYRHKGMWECMDNIRDMMHLNKLWSEEKAFWKIWE